MNQATYYITGMTCGSCAMHIEAEMNNLPEVEKAYVDFDNKTLDLTFSEEPLSFEELQKHMETIGEYSLLKNPPEPKAQPSRSKIILWVTLGTLGIAVLFFIFIK